MKPEEEEEALSSCRVSGYGSEGSIFESHLFRD